MGSVNLRATHAYAYAGRSLKVGDTFAASAKDAHILKLVGRAVDAETEQSGTYQTRDLEPVNSQAGPVPRVKRRYRRRDLTKAEKLS